MDENTKYNRLIGIDFLKIFAIIMVVLTHTSFYAYFGDLYMNIGVPLFILIAAFNNSRKYNKKGYKSINEWYNKQNFWGYFKRITIPYLFFMFLEILILPLVGYAPFSEALLNTVKGGMGPGGYYLVVFAQLFLVFPIFIYFLKRKPALTFLIAFSIQFGFDILFHYVLFPINEYIFDGIYSRTFFRYILLFMIGIIFFEKFEKVRYWYILVSLIIGTTLGILSGLGIITGIYEIDFLLSTIQITGMSFGVMALVIKLGLFIKNEKFKKVVGFVAGSTLHILLFQQLYFCCVGVGKSPMYIDLPVTLIGGFVIYVLWIYVEKLIKLINLKLIEKYKRKNLFDSD